MNNYCLYTCSTVDIAKKYLDDNKIGIINFQFILDGKAYKDDFGSSISYKEFYSLMRSGSTPTSSQPSPDAYIEQWEKALNDGNDILHISLSSGISGAYNSACIARDMEKEKYPDRKIIVIDSLSASGGYGYLVKLAHEKKNQGATLEELESYVNEMRHKMHHIFYVSDLHALIRGGRISAFAGAVGGLLNIYPVMTCNAEGKLEVIEKVRGENKAIKAVVDYVKDHNSKELDYDERFLLNHSDCLDLANHLEDELNKTYTKSKGIETDYIGTTIGCHTGPGLVALFFLGNDR